MISVFNASVFVSTVIKRPIETTRTLHGGQSQDGLVVLASNA